MGQSQLYDIPGEHNEQTPILAIASSAATREDIVFIAPAEVTVTSVTITSSAAVSGVATNTRHLNIIYKGVGGSGTSEIGALDLGSGTNLIAHDETTIASSLTTDMAKGQVLTLELEEIGSGRDLVAATVNVFYQAQK